MSMLSAGLSCASTVPAPRQNRKAAIIITLRTRRPMGLPILSCAACFFVFPLPRLGVAEHGARDVAILVGLWSYTEPGAPVLGYGSEYGRTFMPVKSENAAVLSWDVTRILLAVVSIGGLIAATFWVL